MGTISSSAHFSSPLNIDMIDYKMIHIETLVFGIALSIPEKLNIEETSLKIMCNY